MPVIDLTDDPRLDLAISQNIGYGIGTILGQHQQRKRLEEEKEKRRLQQSETIRILNSGLTGQDLINEFNKMPDAVNNQMIQRLNQKAMEKQAFGDPRPVDAKVAELERLQDSFKKVVNRDAYGNLTTIPGMETLRAGLEKRIKALSIELFELQQRPEPVAPQLPPGPLPGKISEQFEGMPQDQDRTLLDDTISTENAIAGIRAQAQGYIEHGWDQATAQKVALEDYRALKARDTGRFQKYPEIDEATVFAEETRVLTATNPTTGERIQSTDGGKTWQRLN